VTVQAVQSIAILGAGKLGVVVAQLALEAGIAVSIAGSGAAEKIALSSKILTPGAIATTSREAIRQADIVILALPLRNYRTLPAEELAGKLVIDAMNYWWEVDGSDPALTNSSLSSSEMVQAFLKDAHVVKALSHMGYHHLRDEAMPETAAGRKAIAIAGDDSADTARVATLVSQLGFDPVIIGGLSLGKILEPGHELFGATIDKETLLAIVTKAKNAQKSIQN